MYGPRPIRFPAHWCVDYSKYRVFWQAVFQPPRTYSLFLEHSSAAKTFKISHPHNTASYAGQRLRVTVSNFTRENTFPARNQYTLMKFCRYFSNCYIEFTKQFSNSLLLTLHNFKHNFHTISLKIPRLIGDFFCTKTNFVEIFSKKVQRFIVVLKLSKLISCRKNRNF